MKWSITKILGILFIILGFETCQKCLIKGGINLSLTFLAVGIILFSYQNNKEKHGKWTITKMLGLIFVVFGFLSLFTPYKGTGLWSMLLGIIIIKSQDRFYKIPSIQKDAGEILIYLYKFKVEGRELPNVNSLIEQTRWEKSRY